MEILQVMIIQISRLLKFRIYGVNLKIYYFKNKAFERVHGDKLKIDLDSPDAFEELIWSENINNYKESLYRYLDSNFNNSSLEDDLLRNINKLLLIKKKYLFIKS